MIIIINRGKSLKTNELDFQYEIQHMRKLTSVFIRGFNCVNINHRRNRCARVESTREKSQKQEWIKKNFVLSKNQYYASASTIIAEWKGGKWKWRENLSIASRKTNGFSIPLLFSFFLLYYSSNNQFSDAVRALKWKRVRERITITNCKLFLSRLRYHSQ